MPAASPPDIEAVDTAARVLLHAPGPIALAVSGGCDSMVLLHAVARAFQSQPDRAGAARRGRARTVLTFDHGTGPAATAAAALVATEAESLGFAVRVGHGSRFAATEAEWRAARWRFLRDACAELAAAVATAHTRDDQLETIVMRVLRDTGARGLAGLGAPSSGVVRPFLGLPRSAVRRYAVEREVPFIEDPSNASLAHLRNRVRRELLPAIHRCRPRFGEEMLALADRATALRTNVDALALRFVRGPVEDGGLCVAREELSTYDSAALCVLWPAIAAHAGVTLDRRGTLRLAQFTTAGAPGARIQLSGGVEVFRHRDTFVIRRRLASRGASGAVRLTGAVEFGRWRFFPVSKPHGDNGVEVDRIARGDVGSCSPRDDAWSAELPGDRRLWIREWRPGDRMRPLETGAARRVKRFFSDLQVPGPSREGWPVVLADDEIVWIPGVRRSTAAPERSGRPVIRYTCERFDGELSSS